jgi:hypothetical protein
MPTVAPARKKRLAGHPAVLGPPSKDLGHATLDSVDTVTGAGLMLVGGTSSVPNQKFGA